MAPIWRVLGAQLVRFGARSCSLDQAARLLAGRQMSRLAPSTSFGPSSSRNVQSCAQFCTRRGPLFARSPAASSRQSAAAEPRGSTQSFNLPPARWGLSLGPFCISPVVQFAFASTENGSKWLEIVETCAKCRRLLEKVGKCWKKLENVGKWVEITKWRVPISSRPIDT